jgi:hypothetical protein
LQWLQLSGFGTALIGANAAILVQRFSSPSPQCSGFWVAQRFQLCGEGFVLMRALSP